MKNKNFFILVTAILFAFILSLTIKNSNLYANTPFQVDMAKVVVYVSNGQMLNGCNASVKCTVNGVSTSTPYITGQSSYIFWIGPGSGSVSSGTPNTCGIKNVSSVYQGVWGRESIINLNVAVGDEQ